MTTTVDRLDAKDRRDAIAAIDRECDRIVYMLLHNRRAEPARQRRHMARLVRLRGQRFALTQEAA